MNKLLTTVTIILVVIIAGCKQDDYVTNTGVCPLVISTDPVNSAISVPYNKIISATFNEKMDKATINESSFILQQGTTAITGVVSYADSTAKFTPAVALLPLTVYKATIKNTVKDLKGNLLQNNYVWTFTTMPEITLVSNPVIGGTATGGGAYAVGATVTVTATPLPGYAFVNWTENGTFVSLVSPLRMNTTDVAQKGKEVSTSSSYQFTMTAANRTLTANFAVVVPGNFAVTLSSNPAAGGTTSGAGTFVENSIKVVSATANTGYTFVNWTEGGLIVSTSSSYTFTLLANKTLVANFLINTYTLAVSAVNGTVAKNPNQSVFDYGSIVQLTPTPSVGYTFTSWTGDASESANPLSVTMNANKSVTAVFTPNAYTLIVTATNGSVVKNPSQTTYNHGTSVQLTATPNMGYTFTSWSGDATSSTNPLTVSMTSNKNITANFTAIVGSFTLNVTAVNGTVVKNPDLVGYVSGASVQLTATPNSGYTFTSWSGDATGSVNPVTVVMNSNKNVTANFALTGPLVIDLGCAAAYAIMAGSTITSTGLSIINGDVALSPGSALVGFPPGIINGIQEITSPAAANAKLCLTSAYNDGQGRSLNAISLPGQLGGLTLAPGLYSNSSTSGISGTGANGILTLDAQGNTNAVWIFQMGSTLTTDPATSIVLAGGAQAKNIFWIVGTSATLGTTSVFYGNILANQAITLNTGAVLNGRALTSIAAVSLDASTITKP
ncbi:MAG: ice-binding family protein [Paludibacter sp.]